METINKTSASNISILPLKDIEHQIVACTAFKRLLQTESFPYNLSKRKGKILIQDNIEMIRCNGTCGKYRRPQ